MDRHPLWSDEYWLLLMQLYLRKPAGVKPVYSRGMVELSLELHIPPHWLYARMFRLRAHGTPRMARLWETYAGKPGKLAKAVRTLRMMRGLGNASGFYDGVEVRETFERDFRPVPSCPGVKPVMLIMILDLYFRLTPATMVGGTPEVVALARLMRIRTAAVVEAMEAFQACDPYLRRAARSGSGILSACRDVWRRYGNGNPETLSATAAQLRAYFE